MFSYNVLNVKELIDLNSIEWTSPLISSIPRMPSSLRPSHAKKADLTLLKGRFCHLEHLIDEWSFCDPSSIQWEMDLPRMTRISWETSGSGIAYHKITFRAESKGKPFDTSPFINPWFLLGNVEEAIKKLGVKIVIRDAVEELTTEIRKKNTINCRDTCLELRIGETIVLYLTTEKPSISELEYF